jgi:type IX secretion system PorP/SprF family membrane protein
MKSKQKKKMKAMKNFRLQLVTLLLLIIGLNGFAQQDPMYTQYMNNPMIVNPAYAGSINYGHLTGIFRKQWVGIDGAPMTSSLSYSTPIRKYNFGIGASLLYDALGPTTQTGCYLDYSYHIRFDEKGTLALGLKGGFNYYYVNYTGLSYNDPDDDINMLENEALFLPNFGFGAYYFNDKTYIGLSVPKLIRNSLDKKENTVEQLNREEWHVFLMAGHIFELTENIDLKPSFITRYAVGSPLSLEVNATVMLYDKIWLGVMYRFGDAMGGLIRWQINKKLNVGYAYDFSNSALNSFNRGTHEITLGFTFIRNDQNVLSPRYF